MGGGGVCILSEIGPWEGSRDMGGGPELYHNSVNHVIAIMNFMGVHGGG